MTSRIVGGQRWPSGQGFFVQRNHRVTEDHCKSVVSPLDPGLDHVHRRAADEATDERVHWAVVQLLWRRDLL